MVLDWFGSRNTDVADLIARKKYGKAIEAMRAQFKQRPPAVETRLQFVDVLILAGRGKEAVPVLIGLADELTADGQAAKAIGLLKRVEEVEPARPDVEAKLAALVKKEYEASADSKWQPAGPVPEIKPPATASSKVTVSQRVAFDLEEIPDEQPEKVDAAPAAADEPVGAPAAEPEPTPELEAEPEPEQAAQAASTEPEPGSEPNVTHQIRGAFRRFLQELPGGEDGASAPEAEVVPEIEPEAESQVEAEPEPEPTLELAAEAPALEVPASEELRPDEGPSMEVSLEDAPAEITEEPEVQPEPEPEAVVEAAAEPEAAEPEAVVEPEPEQPEPELMVTADEPMSEETFQGQVLDLIEEVVQQPLPHAAVPAEAAAPDERPVRTRGVAESAQHLVTSPLFRELGEAELLAVVRGMRLHTYEAGDVAITEGEAGESLYIVSSGSVRMFVRNPAGHNFEMGVLREGDFFGELSSLSGRPRGSTVVAAGHTELLELAKKTVDQIARTHPRVRETLENVYIQRASSPEAAAIRAVNVDAASHQRAIDVLEAYFGESRWDPRMRLRLADLLVKAGKEDDAVPLLVGLAGDLDRAGYPEKAIAILKKIEKLRKRGTAEVNLAPLKKKQPAPGPEGAATAPPVPKPPAAAGSPPAKAAKREQTVDSFANWMVDVVRDAVAPADAEGPLPEGMAPGYAQGLLASPLFEGLSEDELLAMIRELRLLSFDPGDIIITEGEPGQSLFILTAGAVKISMRNAQGRNVKVTELRAGSFFGEMATVSGKPRTATVTAGQRCELLELDKQAVDQIAARHPRVREVLEEIYVARASSPEAARARAGAGPA